MYEQPSKVLEFNPAFALQYVMDHFEKAAARLVRP